MRKEGLNKRLRTLLGRAQKNLFFSAPVGACIAEGTRSNLFLAITDTCPSVVVSSGLELASQVCCV